MQTRTQTVQTSLLPFKLSQETVQIAEGQNLKQIVDAVFPRKIKGVEIIVTVGDAVVPMQNWSIVKPKQHAIVGVNVVPAGGGGKKNPIAAILSIAVVIAAPYIAAAIAPTAAAAVAAGTATAGQLAAYGAIRIGIGLVGQLVVGALTSVPSQSNQGPTSVAESPTQFIEGASNQVLKFGIIPANLGTNRMFPPQAALPYTEVSNNDQYVRQVFTYGYGKIALSNRKLGETDITEYSEVEIEDRLDGNLDEGTGLYANDFFQEGMSVLLEQSEGRVIRTTQTDADEAEIDITFNSGLTRFDDKGDRKTRTVQFEIVFAPAGTGDFSSGSGAFEVDAQNITIGQPNNVSAQNRSGYGRSTYSTGASRHFGIIILNLDTGVASVRYPTGGSNFAGQSFKYSIPSNHIRIASFQWSLEDAGVSSSLSLKDERSVHYDRYIEDSTDFIMVKTGSVIDIGAGTLLDKIQTVSAATSQALRKSYRISFPVRGQYDVGIRRISTDTNDNRILDKATLSSLKSITHQEPVNQSDISGTAMRMKATDQLNGPVDRYNVIASTILDYYDQTLDVWVEGVSSNPAAIYRYVLQSPAFAKRLPDSRIILSKLQEWSVYCDSLNLTYNRVIDYDASIDDILNDIAAAGMGTPHKIEGNYGVIIDNERPMIKGLVTPRNSSNYSGNINYPEIPHALRVQFRNLDQGYALDERIVYAPGYNALNAELFERLEFSSCTNPTLAYYYGLRYLRTALLQPEVHKFTMDWENLTFNRGDRIQFINDTILVGVGQGLIKELVEDPSDSEIITGFVIDDDVSIPTTDQFGVRIRHADASQFTYYSLTTEIGTTNTFTFSTPIDLADSPEIGSLCAFTEFDKELDLIITEIKINKDQSAKITAINYAPDRFDVDSETIPPFSSNVTLPLEFYRPLAPLQDGEIQSDESVLIRNPDGSFLSRMIIPLENRNEPSVLTSIRARVQFTTEWFSPDILSRSPKELIISGLQDGQVYDFEIRYQRQGGLDPVSKALQLNGVTYFGASKSPADVQGFEVTADDTTGLFEWLPSEDIDFSHYVIRFTRLTENATFKNAQLVADNIKNNRISLPIQSGTYMIKAVDLTGNESVNASLITSIDNGAFNNVVENLIQQDEWEGVKDNCHVIDGNLRLQDPTQQGIYYFEPGTLDLTEVYENVLSSSILSSPAGYRRVRAIDSIRSVSTFFVAQLDIRSQPDIRALNSTRGFDGIEWSTILEMNYSTDGITWSGWLPFKTGKLIFRYIKFRVVISSEYEFLNPILDVAEVVVDMPDRQESGENIDCPVEGVTVTYDAQFRKNPALNLTIQGQQEGDRHEYFTKDTNGFTLKIYNDNIGAYVPRTFDYDAAGYGRVI